MRNEGRVEKGFPSRDGVSMEQNKKEVSYLEAEKSRQEAT